MWCWAGSNPMNFFWAARWCSTAERRARRGIADKIAKPLSMGTVAAAQAIVENRDRKDVARGARGGVGGKKGLRPARFRARSPPAVARPAARARHRARAAHPEGRRAIVFPRIFSALGMLLADERHDFIRTNYADLSFGGTFPRLVITHDEDGQTGGLPACVTPAAPSARAPSRPALCRPRNFTLSVAGPRRDQLVCRRPQRPSARPSTRFTSSATRTISPRRAGSRWSICGLALVGKRAQLTFPSPGPTGLHPDPPPDARGLLRRSPRRSLCPVFLARGPRRRMPHCGSGR